jgi:hypothetical protein
VLHVSDAAGQSLAVLHGEDDLVVRAGADLDADHMVRLVLLLVLPGVVAYVLMARGASGWWKRRYLTTRVFLLALPGTGVWIGFFWIVGLSPAKDIVGGLLLFLTEMLGFIALIRWLVGLLIRWLVGLGSGR